jgi:hypothetical protein
MFFPPFDGNCFKARQLDCCLRPDVGHWSVDWTKLPFQCTATSRGADSLLLEQCLDPCGPRGRSHDIERRALTDSCPVSLPSPSDCPFQACCAGPYQRGAQPLWLASSVGRRVPSLPFCSLPQGGKRTTGGGVEWMDEWYQPTAWELLRKIMLARREEGGGLHWNHPGATSLTSWHILAGHRATVTRSCLLLSPRRRALPHPPDADGFKWYLSTARLCHPRTTTAVLHHTTPTRVPRLVACLAGLALPPLHPSHTKRWPATSPVLASNLNPSGVRGERRTAVPVRTDQGQAGRNALLMSSHLIRSLTRSDWTRRYLPVRAHHSPVPSSKRSARKATNSVHPSHIYLSLRRVA